MMKFKKKTVENYFFCKSWDTIDDVPMYSIYHYEVNILSSHNYDFVLGFAKRLEDSGHIVIYDTSLDQEDSEVRSLIFEGVE